VSIQTLLAQFQARYPSGSVTSELLTIHENRFVVRAIVHLGNITLATAMASATEIEQAEDRAKVRVLTALGINAFPANSSTSTLPYSSTVAAPLEASAHTGEVPLRPTPFVKPTQEFESEPKPIASPISTTSPAASPNEAVPIASKMTFGTGRSSASTEPVSSSFQSSPSFDTFDAALPADIANAEEPSSLPLEEFATTSSAPEPDYSFEPEPIQPAPEATKPPKPASTKGKSAKRKSEPTEEPIAAASSTTTEQSQTVVDQTVIDQIVDRSDVNAKIGVEMKRLGWTVEQGRSHLKRTYGKRSRQELEDIELLDFLDYLEAQPMPANSPF
jgi:hypothetical protein